MNIRLDVLAWTAAIVMTAIPATALAAADTFVWIEGEQGTSTDSQHKGWFEVKEISVNMENRGTADSATGRAGTARTKSGEFTIKKPIDSASPRLRQAQASGKHFSTVRVEMRKAGESQPYLNYVFRDVAISKMQIGGASDKGPEESVTFVYGSVAIHYTKPGEGDKATLTPSKVLPPAAHK